MFNIDYICASGTESAIYVLALIMLIGAGVLVLVLLIDAFLAMLGNKNGIFFRSSKSNKEQEEVQAVEQEYIQSQEIQEEKVADNNLSLVEPYNNIDYEKAREEELALYPEKDEETQPEQTTEEKEEAINYDDLDSILFGDKAEETAEKDQSEQSEETVEEPQTEQVEEKDEFIDIEDDDYQDIIDAINKMRAEEEGNLDDINDNLLEDNVVEEEIAEPEDDEVSLISDEVVSGAENLVVEDETVKAEEIAQDVKSEIEAIRDDEYYRALNAEIAELKKDLEAQKEILEAERQEVIAKNAMLEAEKNELIAELEAAKAEKTQIVDNVSAIYLSEQECEDRLVVLQDRLKNNEKLLRKAKREFKPLERVKKTLERDKNKLRRKEAIVAKQKIVLYGVNNYIDIDEGRAAKLAEDLDLLDGLRLSVQHCEEVMTANADRYPILEQTYNILLSDNAQIKQDIEQIEKDLENIRNSTNYQPNNEEIVETPDVVVNTGSDSEDDGNPVQNFAETVERQEIAEQISAEDKAKEEIEAQQKDFAPLIDGIVVEEIPAKEIAEEPVEAVEAEESINLDDVLAQVQAEESVAEIVDDSVDNSAEVVEEDIDSKLIEENKEKVDEVQSVVQSDDVVPTQEKVIETEVNEEIPVEEKDQDQTADEEETEEEIKYVQKIKNPKPSKKDKIKEENEESEITPELEALLRRTKFSLNDLIDDEEDED